MATHSERLQIVHDMALDFSERGLLFHTAGDDRLSGRSVLIDGRPRINFGSCSYLGLELDPRLRAAAIDAVERFGTQFSSSRTYLSAPLYAELGSLLDELFGGPTVITPNTTLAHLSALPVLISEKDAVILDQQVHFTARLAAEQTRLYGAHVEMLPHSRIDQLEDRIVELRGRHRCVWYLADGVYSMHGDLAPMPELEELLERYECFHLYVDDAHGMGWCGPNGRGYALSAIPAHPRLVVATSLNKCFGAGGGALILPDDTTRRRINMVGGPMIFTGPLQPASLGAAVASARIHLSDEIGDLQERLSERIQHFNRLAEKRELPLIGAPPVPSRFIGLGWPGVTAKVVGRLLADGFWTNLAIFPAVLAKQSGVRCAITLHQTPEDIERLVEAIAVHSPPVLAEENSSPDEVRRLFGLAGSERARIDPLPVTRSETSGLECHHSREIAKIDCETWDRLFEERGLFTSGPLGMLERVFRNGARAEDRWDFHYLMVRDRSGQPVLATFFTNVVWKDDVFARDEVSSLVEERRKRDPGFLTSRALVMGSPLTEGDHLHLDRSGEWREALSMMLRVANRLVESSGARTLVLRDLSADDRELDRIFRDSGFAKIALPSSFVLDVDWESDEEFLMRLPRKFRRFQKKEVLPREGFFEVECIRVGSRVPTDSEWSHLHDLYLQVQQRSLALNTFPIPKSFLREAAQSPNWELLLLRLCVPDGGAPTDRPLAFLCSYVGGDFYAPLIVGLDDRFVRSHGVYRRCVLECLRRARLHGSPRILFGMGADLEKRRFGAQPRSRALFARSDDHYTQDVLAQMEADVASAAPTGAQVSDAASRRALTRPANASGGNGFLSRSVPSSRQSDSSPAGCPET